MCARSLVPSPAGELRRRQVDVVVFTAAATSTAANSARHVTNSPQPVPELVLLGRDARPGTEYPHNVPVLFVCASLQALLLRSLPPHPQLIMSEHSSVQHSGYIHPLRFSRYRPTPCTEVINTDMGMFILTKFEPKGLYVN